MFTNILKICMQSKTNTQILLQQFKRSEQDRKAYIVQKEELEAELASRPKSEGINIAKIQEAEKRTCIKNKNRGHNGGWNLVT